MDHGGAVVEGCWARGRLSPLLRRTCASTKRQSILAVRTHGRTDFKAQAEEGSQEWLSLLERR